MKSTKMLTTEFTIQEIWQASKHSVRKSKKVYSRKNKHKNKLS